MRHGKRVKLTPDLLVGSAMKDDTERSCSGSLIAEQRYCNHASILQSCQHPTTELVCSFKARKRQSRSICLLRRINILRWHCKGQHTRLPRGAAGSENLVWLNMHAQSGIGTEQNETHKGEASPHRKMLKLLNFSFFLTRKCSTLERLRIMCPPGTRPPPAPQSQATQCSLAKQKIPRRKTRSRSAKHGKKCAKPSDSVLDRLRLLSVCLCHEYAPRSRTT